MTKDRETVQSRSVGVGAAPPYRREPRGGQRRLGPERGVETINLIDR
jgi:hypothetical protein